MIQYRKQLFPVSYYKDNIKNNEKIKKEISPLILENSKLLKEKSPDGWLTNKIRTSFSERNLANIFGKNTYFDKELRNEYAKCFNNFFDNYYKITADEIWYNCYINGEYQEAHDHLGDFFNPSAFSCVHFLSFNKDKHRPICFYDPIEQLRSTSLELASHNYQTVKVVYPAMEIEQIKIHLGELSRYLIILKTAFFLGKYLYFLRPSFYLLAKFEGKD